MNPKQILNEIAEEAASATTKFPLWPTDPLHAVAVVGEEAGELTKAVLQHSYEPAKSTLEDVRKEAIQTAAMAFRFIASLDDYVFDRTVQHKQFGSQSLPAFQAKLYRVETTGDYWYTFVAVSEQQLRETVHEFGEFASEIESIELIEEDYVFEDTVEKTAKELASECDRPCLIHHSEAI